MMPISNTALSSITILSSSTDPTWTSNLSLWSSDLPSSFLSCYSDPLTCWFKSWGQSGHPTRNAGSSSNMALTPSLHLSDFTISISSLGPSTIKHELIYSCGSMPSRVCDVYWESLVGLFEVVLSHFAFPTCLSFSFDLLSVVCWSLPTQKLIIWWWCLL